VRFQFTILQKQERAINIDIITKTSRMGSSTQHQTNNTILHAQANTTIPSTANLTISMTVKTELKRRPRKYRAVERPNGVNSEQPRYQPATSAPIRELKFEKKLFTLSNLPIPSKGIEKARENNGKEDMLGIGAFVDDLDSDGSNELAARGRGGYNGLARSTPGDIYLESFQQDASDDMTSIDRFLREDGAWSSFSQREG
jgi:hypothetical protein